MPPVPASSMARTSSTPTTELLAIFTSEDEKKKKQERKMLTDYFQFCVAPQHQDKKVDIIRVE